MKTLSFKTNINCGACVATVTPFLDAESSVNEWSVETSNREKILTVSGDQVNAEAVQEAVRKAGFRIEKV
jgi:copper chaperone